MKREAYVPAGGDNVAENEEYIPVSGGSAVINEERLQASGENTASEGKIIPAGGGSVTKIEILKPISGGIIKAVASKSHAHRMLICAALADKETYIECGELSNDISTTVECLENLGARISNNGAGFNVKPITRPVPENSIITQNCGESGTTLRFMLPICCALGVSAEFHMRGRLSERPMSPLLSELTSHGCEIVDNTRTNESVATLKCSGKLSGGVYELPGNISSQFISGLLFALSLLPDDSVLSVLGREESRPYIAMTLKALDAFGITTKRFATNPAKGAAYGIKGSQIHHSPGNVKIEGDWSNAAFWLCAGAIGSEGVTCTGLNFGSAQGDMSITRLLERFGAKVTYEGDRVTVAPAKLHGIQIDAIDTPDLVPALSVVAAVAEGETVISNAGRLRMKESDRLKTITDTLYTLGANINESGASILIKGKKSLKGGTVDSFNDHRIAMMAAIASIVCDNPVTIRDAQAVNKSYPEFFNDFEAMGGLIRTL